MAAEAQLSNLIRTKPEITFVSLSKLGITSMEPLLPLFEQLPHIKELDLTDNGIQSLPASLGAAFPSLEALLLAGNPIPAPEAVLPGLQSLPRLRRLTIDLGSVEEEEQCVVALQHIVLFNDVDVATEEPVDDQPQASTTASAAAATDEDAQPPSNPPATAAAADVDGQAAAPQDDGNVAEKAGEDEDPPIREVAMTEDDLESVALLFGALKALRAGAPGVDDSALTLAFDGHMRAVMDRLHGRLDGEDAPFVRQAEILKSKHELYEVVTAQVAEHAATGPASRQFAAVVRKLRGAQEAVVAELPRVVAEATEHYNRKLQRLQRRCAAAESQNTELVEAAAFLESELARQRADAQEAIAAERQQVGARVRALEQEAAALRVALRQHGGTDAVKRVEAGLPPRAAHPQPHHQPQDRVTDGAASSSALHGAALTAADLVTSAAAAAAAASSASNSGGMQPSQPLPATGYAARHAAARVGDVGAIGTSGPSLSTAQRAAAAAAGATAVGLDPTASAATSVATAPTSSGLAVKALTLKQLKTMIEAIYASKRRFDAKCAKAKLPRETMEQHMYTYLNHQYGLRKLIVEHASAIVRAVNRFSAVDNDVCVFGQLLRNEVEEKFVATQTSLKGTVKDLLRVFLKGKFPLKTDGAIDKLLEQRMATVVFEEEWSDMVRYMYKEDDAEALCRIVREIVASDPRASSRLRHLKAMQAGKDAVGEEGADLVGEAGEARRLEARSRKEAQLHQEAVTRGAINYSSLLKTMLDFQLRGHQKFLEKFRRVFTSVDTDSNGVISEQEFRSLVATLDSSKNDQDMDELVALVDPYGHGHITFSDCVEMLLGSA